MERKQTSFWNGWLARWGAHHFDNPARRHKAAPFFDRLENLLRPASVVLDLGAGTGFVTMECLADPRVARVIACDLSAEMLDHLQRKAEKRGFGERLELCCADAASTGIEDDSVDVVVAYGMLHETADCAAVIREAGRVLG